MPATNVITQARLKELLNYDLDTGLFVWLVYRNHLARAGDVAGYRRKDGYIGIGIDGVEYLAHRLIFLYVLDYMPVEVDHDNRIRDDNRWKNLNPATRTKNNKNQSLRCDNTSGYVGVSLYKPTGKWIAQIGFSGKEIHLGYFTDKADAIAARQAADIQYGFHENHGGT